MRILQINNIYARLSTGKLVADLHHAYLDNGIESYVCYGRGPIVKEKNVMKFSWEVYAKANKVRGMMTGVLYGGCYLATLRLIHTIKEIRPDVVHLQCINDDSVNIYMLLNYLKKHQIPTVATLHAEFLHTANCGHAYQCNKWKTGCFACEQRKLMHMLFDNTKYAWKKMRRAFSGFDKNRIMITSVSPWLESRAAESAILGQYQHCSVLNCVNTEVFYPRYTKDLRNELNISEDKKIALFVTSDMDSPSKGGEHLIELARKLPEYVFVVLGTPGSRSDLPANIMRVGRIYDQDKVAQYYSMADVTLILSKAETFSMPVAESLCCGTPVIGFKAGGPETIAIREYSKFCEQRDTAQVYQWLKDIDRLFDAPRHEIAERAIKKYDKENMMSEYIQVYNSVLTL